MTVRKILAGLMCAVAPLALPAPAQAQVSSGEPAHASVVRAPLVSGRYLLARLAVRAPSHASTYRRTYFKLWTSSRGCTTRNLVLIKESRVRATVGSRCVVRAGRWVSWYDGLVFTVPSRLDIDHVVPLHEAWMSGAWSWTVLKRTHYANDLGLSWSLDAVSAHSNRSKGDRDPAHWLPIRSVCAYAIHWVAIKYRWRLTIDTAERATLARLLAGSCGAIRVPLPSRGS